VHLIPCFDGTSKAKSSEIKYFLPQLISASVTTAHGCVQILRFRWPSEGL
jgi:hypothetical protein